MTTSLKKLLTIVSCIGALYIPSLNAQTVTLTTGGIGYSISNNPDQLSNGMYNGELQVTPWWNNATLAQALSLASVGTTLSSTYFVYEQVPDNPYVYLTYQNGVSNDWTQYYEVGFAVSAVGGAPEIDGSLAPKVGFLLGCLFLMFGRKKQNSEPMLTA